MSRDAAYQCCNPIRRLNGLIEVALNLKWRLNQAACGSFW